MSCTPAGVCKCAPFQSGGRCSRDEDCACRPNWLLVGLVAAGAVVALALLVWGLREERRASGRGDELRELLARKLGATGSEREILGRVAAS